MWTNDSNNNSMCQLVTCLGHWQGCFVRMKYSYLIRGIASNSRLLFFLNCSSLKFTESCMNLQSYGPCCFLSAASVGNNPDNIWSGLVTVDNYWALKGRVKMVCSNYSTQHNCSTINKIIFWWKMKKCIGLGHLCHHHYRRKRIPTHLNEWQGCGRDILNGVH